MGKNKELKLFKRQYNKKKIIIPKDKIIQFRVTTAQEIALKRILQQRGITIADYFTKIIDFEIQKDMIKNQFDLFLNM